MSKRPPHDTPIVSIERQVRRYPYHIIVFLPARLPRLMGMAYGKPFKRFALPLRTDAIAVDLHPQYQAAYRAKAIAVQIWHYHQYAASELPFPSLLTDEQKQAALDAVHAWQTELTRLQSLT